MSTLNRVISILLLVAAGVLSIVQNVVMAPKGIENLIDIASAKEGYTLVEQIENEKVVLNLVNDKGVKKKHLSFPQTRRGETTSIADFVIDDENKVYLIRDFLDAKTGEFIRQNLEVYDLDWLVGKKKAVHSLENEDRIRYRWLNLSSVLVLMGTNPQEDILQRLAFDPEAAASKMALASKGERQYSLNAKEGIYEAVPAAADLAYITMSGKVMLARENMPAKEIYPARVLQQLMYPTFIIPVDGKTVMIGEQESGDISLLDLENGKTEILMGGAEKFSGVSDYMAGNVLKLAAQNTQQYTAVVKNTGTDMYELIVKQEGNIPVITRLRPSVIAWTGALIGDFILYVVLMVLAYGLVYMAVQQIRNSNTILMKLAFSAIPLLVISFILFGAFSYRFYSESVEGSFKKQVEDEGNLLTALFGTESFNEIEFPYDYTTEGYSYLIQQMRTREVYTRTAYYEGATLYSGVDEDLPCFYPFDMVFNKDAVDLFEKAAYTGVAQTGILQDRNGRRISCVTPIGGVDGGTIYLLETGIYMANVDEYTGRYLWRYVLVAVVFILAITMLLLAVFTKILGPLAEIKLVLEEFTKGNRKARMESTTKDELSDISRVFNKMASDIDIQLYNLKSLSETYYRFVPQRIFRLMGKDNLGDLQLGNHVEGCYNILCAELTLNSERMSAQVQQETANKFFNILNQVSEEYDASLVADNVNLCSLKLICKEDGEKGVNMALSALAQIDSYNASAGLKDRMEVMFLLHRTDLYYGICGNEKRYVPAMISAELELLGQRMQLLRKFSSRLIVTQTAYDTIETGNYYSRFIGKLEDPRFDNLGLYDFYDESSSEIIRLINNTRGTFDKAIELYGQKRYYDAKNLFAVVLRENQYDNVARYYIFQCEKKL